MTAARAGHNELWNGHGRKLRRTLTDKDQVQGNAHDACSTPRKPFVDLVMSGTCSNRRQAGVWSLLIFSLMCASTSSRAQLPGAPVLQNAWATPGIVGAINFGSGSDGEVYAVAGSWAPTSGRFQLSGGAGSRRFSGIGSRSVFGLRLAVPFGGGPTSNFGFAAFAGGGGGAGGKSKTADSLASTSQVPIGAAIGWRRALGASHGLSLYASPSYVFFTGGGKSGGLVRTSVAADLGITASLGLTAGVEFGQTRVHEIGGPSGPLYGVGIAYAFGHR